MSNDSYIDKAGIDSYMLTGCTHTPSAEEMKRARELLEKHHNFSNPDLQIHCAPPKPQSLTLTYEGLVQAKERMKELQQSPKRYFVIGEEFLRRRWPEFVHVLGFMGELEDFVKHAKTDWFKLPGGYLKIANHMPDVELTEITPAVDVYV